MTDAIIAPRVRLAFIGFGEAASAFVQGLGLDWAARTRTYDIKTDSPDGVIRAAKWSDYASAGVEGCSGLGEALSEAEVVFSTVTADQALVAATAAAAHIGADTLYFDCNSCAPQTKAEAARLIDGGGGRYVDTAVMAPVHPALHRTPLLLSGPHVGPALAVVAVLGMNATAIAGPVGASSSIKMVRSIMVKGLEALFLECVLAGRRAGVDQTVLDSLDASFPGFGFKQRAGYMLERAMRHGVRRAEELKEAARMVDALGLPSRMSAATAAWQQQVGDLKEPAPSEDYRVLADALLARLLVSQDEA